MARHNEQIIGREREGGEGEIEDQMLVASATADECYGQQV